MERAPPTEGEARAAVFGGACVCMIALSLVVAVAVIASDSSDSEDGGGDSTRLAATRAPVGTTTPSPTAPPTLAPTHSPTDSKSPTLSPNQSPTTAPTAPPSASPATPAPTASPTPLLAPAGGRGASGSGSESNADDDGAAVERTLLLVGLPVIGVIVVLMCGYFCTVGWSEVKDEDDDPVANLGGRPATIVEEDAAVVDCPARRHALRTAQSPVATPETAGAVGNGQAVVYPYPTPGFAEAALLTQTADIGGIPVGWAQPVLYTAPETQEALPWMQPMQMQQQQPQAMYTAPETQEALPRMQQQQQQAMYGEQQAMYTAPETQETWFAADGHGRGLHHPADHYRPPGVADGAWAPQGPGGYMQSDLAPEANYSSPVPQQQPQPHPHLPPPQFQPSQAPASATHRPSTMSHTMRPTATSPLPQIPAQAAVLHDSVPNIGDLLRPMRDLGPGGLDPTALKRTDIQLDLYKSRKPASSGEEIYMVPPPKFQQGHATFVTMATAPPPPQGGLPTYDASVPEPEHDFNLGQDEHQQNQLLSVSLQAEQHHQLKQLKGRPPLRLPQPLPPPVATSVDTRGGYGGGSGGGGGVIAPPHRFSSIHGQTSI